MESKYERIKNAIKESGKLIYWYKESGELLIVDSSKKASRKKLLNSNMKVIYIDFLLHSIRPLGV
jgi:hypothetical protein